MKKTERAAWVVAGCIAVGTAGAWAQRAGVGAAPARTRDGVERLLDLLKLEKTVTDAVSLALVQVMSLFPEMGKHPDILVDYADERLSWEAIKPVVTEWYRESFTAEELDELVVFYGSPVGQKWVQAAPAFALQMENLARDRFNADRDVLELRLKNRELERLLEASVFPAGDAPAPKQGD